MQTYYWNLRTEEVSNDNTILAGAVRRYAGDVPRRLRGGKDDRTMKNCKCEPGAWEITPNEICDSFVRNPKWGFCLECQHDEACHNPMADALSPEHWTEAHDFPALLRRLETVEAKVNQLEQTIKDWTSD